MPTDNAALNDAMKRFAEQGDPGALGEVCRRLLAARLCVEVAPPVPGQPGARFIALRAEDGRTGVAAFTDRAAFERWKPGQPAHVAEMGAVDLLKLVHDGGHTVLVLNAGSEPCWEIGREDMASLVAKRVDEVVSRASAAQDTTQVTLHPVGLAPAPTALEWFASTLKGEPLVEAVYAFRAAFGDAEPELCLGLVGGLSEAEFDRLTDVLSPACEGMGVARILPLPPQMMEGVQALGTVLFRRAGR